MTKVLVTVSQATDGSFWCHTEDDVYGGGLNGAGASVKDAKQDLMECLEDAKADYVESGNVPQNEIQITPASILTEIVKSEIIEQISRWRFEAADYVAFAEFDYKIVKQ